MGQVEGPVARFLGDGAYDGEQNRKELANRFEGVEVIIPPPKTAVPSPQAETAPTVRDKDILAIQTNGKMAWQKQIGYGQGREEKP